MDNYIDKSHGMELYPDKLEFQRENENGIHILVIYYILKILNNKFTEKDRQTFIEIVYNLESFNSNGNRVKGLYDRGANESLHYDQSQIRTISHDNLNAIACLSKELDLEFHKDIYNHGKQNLWRFDNIYPDKPRWERLMHPRDIIFWSFLNKNFLSIFFIWEVLFECLLTCYKKYDLKPKLHRRILYKIQGKEYTPWKQIATSGKLLALIRLFTIRKTWYGKITWKICTHFINKNFKDGWKGVVDFYFKNPQHPIRQEIEELYKNNKELFNA